jgi:hypothetical protein
MLIEGRAMTFNQVKLGVTMCALAILLGGIRCDQLTAASSDAVSDKNRELSYSYGQLYRAASGLKHLKKIIYVKVESDAIERLVQDISAYGTELAQQLEQLDSDYPSLSIDDPGLPALEIKKRKAVVWDQLFTMAPIVGQTGKAFERTLLLSQLGLLNNLRFLAEVTREAEKNDSRKRFVQEVQSRFDSLYKRTARLLEQQHFC